VTFSNPKLLTEIINNFDNLKDSFDWISVPGKAVTYTGHQNIEKKDKYPRRKRDSNPRSQRPSNQGLRLGPCGHQYRRIDNSKYKNSNTFKFRPIFISVIQLAIIKRNIFNYKSLVLNGGMNWKSLGRKRCVVNLEVVSRFPVRTINPPKPSVSVTGDQTWVRTQELLDTNISIR
jgi:hypothetical protein